jgi:hypothetical protein
MLEYCDKDHKKRSNKSNKFIEGEHEKKLYKAGGKLVAS